MIKRTFLILLLISEVLAMVLARVYYVLPTEHRDSAACINDTRSCPDNQECHTMDYYASNGHTFFPPASNINITLYFMCGVHNLTIKLFAYNISTFSIVGAESAASVVVNMPIRIVSYREDSFFTFVNVKKIIVENLTINIPSIDFEGVNCHLMIRNSYLYGYNDISTSPDPISTINTTHSITSLVNCTLKQNAFVRTTARGVLSLKNCLVERYNHPLHSAIQIVNSTIVLAGNVQFIYNVPMESVKSSLRGGVLRMSDSTLNTKKAANVSFFGNAASSYGGAVYMEDSRMYLLGNLLFINNTAGLEGGALFAYTSIIKLGSNAILKLLNNSSPHAGAVSMVQSQFIIDGENAHLSFLRNGAKEAGAIKLHSSNLNISKGSVVDFIDNSAELFGGSALLILTRLCVSGNAQVLFDNNTAMQGGAAYLYSSVIKITSGSVCIKNNTALDIGGGLYAVVQPNAPCFYYPRVGSADYVDGTIQFEANCAKNGIGEHIYGSSIHDSRCNYEIHHYLEKPFCHRYHKVFSFFPDPTSNPSVVSSSAMRVCLCDINGMPECAQLSKVFVTDIVIYSGETFHLPIAIVGYDFGTTKGTVHSGFVHLNGSLSSQHLLSSQYDQWAESTQCTNVNYTVFSSSEQEIMYLHAHKVSVNAYGNITSMNQSIENWHQNHCIDEDLLTTPVFLNITFLPCPPGFYQKYTNELPSGCICYRVLTDHNFKCSFFNKTGYHVWNSSMWVSATSSGILYYNPYCSLDYCKSGPKVVNLGKEPNTQCAFNHAGTLCGGCQMNYSLAIGSSRCIRCANSNSVALLIFFVAAGIVLVFFILALNLTVTQGLINGLVFYANILWTYKPAWFPPQQNILVSIVQVFVAWLNLDFGIESCFVRGLNALWKTWLQFLFPFYIWAIAGCIIVVARRSSRVTKLIGSRAVPLLATLCLLSYMKLLRTVIEALAFAMLRSYPEGYDYAVWYLDGNYSYFKPPYSYLFIAALLALVLLWCPYTFILFSIQWLRRVSHIRCLRRITKFTPFYDACLAPLKDRHHYWFGVLLIVRGMLLLIYSLTFTIIPDINLLILIVVLVLVLLYTVCCRVYRRKSVKILESILLGNLIVLCGSTKLVTDRSIILVTSIGLAFIQFCGIVLWSLVKLCIKRSGWNYVNLEETVSSEFIHTRDSTTP